MNTETENKKIHYGRCNMFCRHFSRKDGERYCKLMESVLKYDNGWLTLCNTPSNKLKK